LDSTGWVGRTNNLLAQKQAIERANGMKFYTAINCMDGRVQLPVIQYLQKRFNVEYVDSITEAGPTLILAKQNNKALVQAILERVEISLDKHNSVGIAIVGHQDCAGIPAPHDEQIAHLINATQFLRSRYENMMVIGLWVDSDWEVHEIIADEKAGG
jgi:hypothetical protein